MAIGSLLIELGVNMAAFHEGMTKATYTSKQTARDISNAFKTMGGALESVMSQFGTMGTVVGSTLSSIGSTMAAVSKQMGSMGGAAGYAAIGLGGLGAAGLAAGATLFSMGKAGNELIHSLVLMSQKTGMSVRDLQTLQAAGSLVGLGLEDMAQGFRRFDQAIAQTGRHTGQAQVILKALGVTATTQKEALYQVADAFQKMDDGPRKAADAIALFGRAGLQMIPLLNQGRAGFMEAAAMVDRYGAKVGKDATKANEAYMVSQAKMTLAWDAFKIDIGTKVLPSIALYTTAMAEALKSTRGLGDEITGHFGESFKSLTLGFSKAFASGPSLFGPLGQLAAGLGGAAGALSSASESHGPSASDRQADAAAAKKEAEGEVEAKLYAIEKQRFDLLKTGGPAATALAKAQEDLNEQLSIGNSAAEENAIKIQKTIPGLEKKAKAEKDAAEAAAKHAAEMSTLGGVFEYETKATAKANQALVTYSATTKILTAQQKEGFGRSFADAIQQQGDELDLLMPKMELLNTSALGFGGVTNPLVANSVKEVTDALEKQIDAFHKVTDAEVLAQLQAQGANAVEIQGVRNLQDQLTKLQASTQKVDEVWQKLGDTMSNGLAKSIETGKGLTKVFQDMVKQIEDAIIKQALLGTSGKGQGGLKTGGLFGAANQAMGGVFSGKGSGGGIIGDIMGLFGIKGKGAAGNTPDGSSMNPLYVTNVDTNGNPLNLGALGNGSTAMAAIPAIAKSTGGGGMGLLSLLGMIPGLAGGGDVSPGKAYIVGEKQPELFVPGTSGRIVPNFASSTTKSGDTIHQHININGVTDFDSFKKSQAQVARGFSAVASRANNRG